MQLDLIFQRVTSSSPIINLEAKMHEIDLPNFYYECESKSRVLYILLVYSMLDSRF